MTFLILILLRFYRFKIWKRR